MTGEDHQFTISYLIQHTKLYKFEFSTQFWGFENAILYLNLSILQSYFIKAEILFNNHDNVFLLFACEIKMRQVIYIHSTFYFNNILLKLNKKRSNNWWQRIMLKSNVLLMCSWINCFILFKSYIYYIQSLRCKIWAN